MSWSGESSRGGAADGKEKREVQKRDLAPYKSNLGQPGLKSFRTTAAVVRGYLNQP
jgi:hypothetical protein